MWGVPYFPVVFSSGAYCVQLPRKLGVLSDEHVSFHALDYVRLNALEADWP